MHLSNSKPAQVEASPNLLREVNDHVKIEIKQLTNYTEDEVVVKLLEVSKMVRTKILSVFLCQNANKEDRKKGCKMCKKSLDSSDISMPCLFQKSNVEMQENLTGFLVRFALLTCVRANEGKVREAAITNFRALVNFDDNEITGDIKKMNDMPLKEWERHIKLMSMTDASRYFLLQNLTKLLYSAVQCALKVSACCMENVGKETMAYQLETVFLEFNLNEFETLLGTQGIFGYVTWCAKFVLYALSSSSEDFFLLAEMWKFNTEICPALVTVYKYGSGTHPWMEALLYNFTNQFSTIWTDCKKTKQTDMKPMLDWESPSLSVLSPGTVSLRKTLLARLPPETSCDQCCKRFPRSCKKVYPVCFQSSPNSEHYPREVACLERPANERYRDVEPRDLSGPNLYPRTVRLVCSVPCLLHKLAGINPNIHEVIELGHALDVNSSTALKGLTDVIVSTKYVTLRYILAQHYLTQDTITRLRKEQTTNSTNTVTPRPSLPRSDPTPSKEVASAMDQYEQNMLLHSPKDPDVKCNHHKVSDCIVKYHPIEDMTKYTANRDSEGVPKACIDFQIKLETCERLDLPLQDPKSRAKLITRIKQLSNLWIHAFPTVLADIPVSYLREHCHKLVVDASIPSNHMSEMKKVRCLLGIWYIHYDANSIEGLIICKSPKTYYCFLPHSTTQFWTIITQNMADTSLYSSLFDLVHTSWDRPPIPQSLSTTGDMCSVDKYKLAFSTLKAFSVIRQSRIRTKLKDMFSPGSGASRFQAIQNGGHDWSKSPNVLLNEASGITRFTAKHLLGCPHSLNWQGCIVYYRNTPSLDNWKFTCTGWALECREASTMIQGGQTPSLPTHFWKMMPEKLFILSLQHPERARIRERLDKEGQEKLPKFILEIGSVSLSCLDDFRDPTMVTVAFISEELSPKYLIIFSLIDEKIHCDVILDQKEVDTCYDMIKNHFPKNSGHHAAEQVGIKDIHNQSAGYVDKTIGSVLWTGDMQLCFIKDDHLVGFEQNKDYLRLLDHCLLEAKGHSENDDLGGIRNCAFVADSGHEVLSTYATLVTEHSLPSDRGLGELFSNKNKSENVTLVGFNVERKIVESVIGTFKKCFFFYVHMQDKTYIHTEMKDSKTTMIGLFLEPQSMMKDLLQLSGAEIGRRLMVLKYDSRMGVVVAYVPKEKGKGQQLWSKLTENSRNLVAVHTKAFKKLKRPEKVKKVDSFSELRNLEDWAKNIRNIYCTSIDNDDKSIKRVDNFEEMEAPDGAGSVQNDSLTLEERVAMEGLEDDFYRHPSGMVVMGNGIGALLRAETEAGVKPDPGLGAETCAGSNTGSDAGWSIPGVDKSKKLSWTVFTKDGSYSTTEPELFKTSTQHLQGQKTNEKLAPSEKMEKVIPQPECSKHKVKEDSDEKSLNVAPDKLAVSEDKKQKKRIRIQKKKNKKIKESDNETKMENNEPVIKSDVTEENIAEEEVDPTKICWHCGQIGSDTEDGVKLSKCRGCRKARYCDTDCQKADWKRHGEFCRLVMERRKEREKEEREGSHLK